MQKDELIEEKDFEETACNVLEIFKKYEDIISKIKQKELYSEKQFVDFLNKDLELEKIFNSDISDIYNITNNSQKHPFRKGLITNINNTKQRNEYSHEIIQRTPEKMWKCIGYENNLFQQNNFINTNDPPQYKPCVNDFIDLKTIILHILYHINLQDKCKIKLKNKIDEKLKTLRSSYKKNSEAELKNKTLQKFLDDSSKKEDKIKIKILGYSTMRMTKNDILDYIKTDEFSINSVNNSLEMLKNYGKIIELKDGRIIPFDKALCKEAFAKIKDEIINTIWENNG